MRGWVLATAVEPEAWHEKILSVKANVSAGPSAEMVKLTEFAAWRWAGPQSAFLRAASPANIVPLDALEPLSHALYPDTPKPIPVPERESILIMWPPSEPRADLLASLLASEGSTLLIVPDPNEQDSLAQVFFDLGRNVLVVRSDLPASERTRIWAEARSGAWVVVGGRSAVFSPVPDLNTVIILDDADEALAEERAPAWHARDLVIERARRAKAQLVIVSPVPTTEAVVAAGPPIDVPVSISQRGWPNFEIVDQRQDPPGLGLLALALGPALHQALSAGQQALCVLNRKGRARLLACRTCGELVRCSQCEAVMSEVEDGFLCNQCLAHESHQCRHCGSSKFKAIKPGVTRVRDALAGLVPHHHVVAIEAGDKTRPKFDVAIGTETILHGFSGTSSPKFDRPIGLVAFLDFDQELLAPRYRAIEQAAWLLVRAARLVGARSEGGKVLVQTRIPDHEVLLAAVSGNPQPLLVAERERRQSLGFPPLGGLAAMTGEIEAVDMACDSLRDRLEITGGQGDVLLRASSSTVLCDALAAVDLGPARAKGRLRIDVDPLRV